jgi:predicted enzyme related to lactoylglutathione lyase
MKLTGVMVNSERPEVLGEFYTKVFGEPGWHEDNWYGYQVGTGTIMIGPHSDIKGASKEPARVMITIESENVSSEFEKIKACGAKVVAEPYQPDAESSPDVWLATLADPDGNYLQLASPWEA